MIKVVLDANQYASALIKPRGNSARLIEMVHEGQFALAMSAPILEEVRCILSYPKLKKLHGRSAEQTEFFLKKLERVAILTPASLSLSVVEADPTDDKYVVCALESQADFIISGDRHLTDLVEFRGIRIVNPAEFLRIVGREIKE